MSVTLNPSRLFGSSLATCSISAQSDLVLKSRFTGAKQICFLPNRWP